MTKRFKLLFIFILFFSTSYSQEYFVQNFSMQNGLPNNQLHNIIQAKDNTLWFTTFHGFCQYDGANFITYTEEDGLISNHTLNVFEDSKGRIWVSPWSQEGINIIDNGKVITPKDSVLNIKWVMNTAFEDNKGRIWFFGNNTVIKYEDEKFDLVYSSKDEKEYIHPNNIAVINDNELYVTQMENGVIKVTLEPFSIEHINHESHGINNICYSALKDKSGKFWFGCYGGIYSFENGLMTEHKIPISFDKCRVWWINEDDDGFLWLATYGGGVVRWDKKDEFIIVNSKNGLSDDFCYSVLIDNENNKWITTDIGGLDKLTDFSFQYYTVNSGLKSNHVNGISQLNNGSVVLGTEKGLSIIKNNRIDTTIHEDLSITSLAKGEKIWYTSKSGYGILNDDLEISNFDHDNTYNFIDPKENVVAGLSRVVKNYEEKFFHEFLIIPSAFYLGDVLYIGTNYGLLQSKNNKISKLKNLDHDQFPEVLISVKISENEVLVSNPNELVYIKNSGDSLVIKRFSSNKLGGIIRIFSILLDGNDLWVSAQNTLAKIDFDELLNYDHLVMEKYDVSSGFIRGLNSAGAIFKDDEGSIWVGTSDGAVKFSPKLAQKNNLPPILKFKEIKLFSRLFDDNLYKKNGIIEFPYDKNHLSFDLQAISLSHPEKIQCKYRMLGLNDKWSEVVPLQKVTYPVLNPGEYTFEFIASNGSGTWSKHSKKYSFVILFPYWKTGWFYTIIAFSLGVIILILFYFQKKKAENKQLIQEKFTHDILVAQEDERRRISKNLHDGIGQNLLLIKNAFRSEKKETAEQMIHSTIEEVRSISRNLHPFQLEKFGLTKSLESMVEEINQNIREIIFTEDIINIDDLFSKEQEINIYRMIQECTNNIIKHSKANSARIVLIKKDFGVEITIFDNGVGFDLSKNKDLINSLGLKSIRERVKYLDGTVIFDSSLEKGTKISILIKYGPK